MANTTCTAFVISPIGEEESDIRRRSDQVLSYVIKPALDPLNCDVIRADRISESGLITSQVIQHIVEDELVIADLTDRNPNVFYELAIRHAIKKPIIQIIEQGEQLPFDVIGMRTIQIDHRDLGSANQAKEEILLQAKNALEGTGEIESPISVAVELGVLKRSDDPNQRSIAEMIDMISEIRASISNLESKITDPTNLLPRDYVEYLSYKINKTINNMISHQDKYVLLHDVQIEGLIKEAIEVLESIEPINNDVGLFIRAAIEKLHRAIKILTS